MREIKNCPHCNGTASLFRYYHCVDPYDDEGRHLIMVQCDVCGATGAQKEVDAADWQDWERLENSVGAADCITAWNLRCLSDDIETLIDERIAAALDEQAQTVPESAILAAGLLAEIEDEETTAAD